MRHIGFLVVSNNQFKDFRYPLMLRDENAGYAVKTPGGNTVPVLLTRARRQGAKLSLDSILDAETKADVQRIWKR